MYLGKVAEVAEVQDLYLQPRHPYSNALLSAVPLPDPDLNEMRERIVLIGDVPSPIRPPSGCRFHTRCPKAQQNCVDVEPIAETKFSDPPSHLAACHHPVADGENLVDARAGIEQEDDTSGVTVAVPFSGTPLTPEEAR